MILTRKQRTNVFRKQIKHEWAEKFWKFIEDNPDKPWWWDRLSRNPNITFGVVLAYPDKTWSWYSLSLNPNITFDNVLAHPDKPWDWIGLSQHPNITFDIVLAHPNKPWNWKLLSQNPNITFDIVLAHPDKPWHWGWLSRNTFSKAKQQFIEKRCNEYLSAYRIQQYWNKAITDPTN